MWVCRGLSFRDPWLSQRAQHSLLHSCLLTGLSGFTSFLPQRHTPHIFPLVNMNVACPTGEVQLGVGGDEGSVEAEYISLQAEILWDLTVIVEFSEKRG